MTTDHALPTAQELRKRLALTEAQKATEDARRVAAAEAEKKALLEQLSKPAGISVNEHMKRAAAVIERAVVNGQTEVLVTRFPHELCTDGGRAINQSERGWENTLTGQPKELYGFWDRHLRPLGYRLRAQILDYPGGIPGDIGATLCWGDQSLSA